MCESETPSYLAQVNTCISYQLSALLDPEFHDGVDVVKKGRIEQ
jgi:hypothetical protein